MGAGGRNFYNDAFSRLGYGDEVARVAELWQAVARRGPRCGADRPRTVDESRWYADGNRGRVDRYRAVGITTLLTKLEGDYSSSWRRWSDCSPSPTDNGVCLFDPNPTADCY